MTLTKRQIKILGEAYDKLYDLNCSTGYGQDRLKVSNLVRELERQADSAGYCFKLSKTAKWKAKAKQKRNKREN